MGKKGLIRVEPKPIAGTAWDESVEGAKRRYGEGRNAHTLRSELKSLEIFGRWLGVDNFRDLCFRILGKDKKPEKAQGAANILALQYRDWLVGQGYAPSTVNRRLSALKNLVEHFKFGGEVPWDLDVQYVPVEAYRDTAGPGTETFAATMDGLQKQTDPMAVRDRTILIILHDGAVRRGELVSLDLEHVDFKNHCLWVKAKKRTARVDIPMGKEMEEAVVEWIRVRGNEPGPLFTNFDPAGKGKRLTDRSVYRVTKRHGVGRPHGIRHLALTEYGKATNGNIIEVMKFGRQRDPKTTMIYIDNMKKRSGEAANVLAEFRKVKPTEPGNPAPDPGSGGEKRPSARARGKGRDS